MSSKRYFMVSHFHSVGSGFGFGSYSFDCVGFPSRKHLEFLIEESDEVDKATIQNIFEFKTKEDYDAWKSKSFTYTNKQKDE